mgnify:CR=1 FL=1
MFPAKPEIFWILFCYDVLRVEIFASDGWDIIRKSGQIEHIVCFLSKWDC